MEGRGAGSGGLRVAVEGGGENCLAECGLDGGVAPRTLETWKTAHSHFMPHSYRPHLLFPKLAGRQQQRRMFSSSAPVQGTDPRAGQPTVFRVPSAWSLTTSQDPRLPSLGVMVLDVGGGLLQAGSLNTLSPGPPFSLFFWLLRSCSLLSPPVWGKGRAYWCFVLRGGE